MPLLDHFRSPLYPRHSWESFHAMWAAQIVGRLNRKILPKDYLAEAHTHVGRIEVDVAAFEDTSPGQPAHAESNGGVAVATLAPPTTTLVLPPTTFDEIEVRVFETSSGLSLAAAIEFVSPGNKDRREERRAFASKCASYLYAGVGLIIVDVVTTRLANLHNDLMEWMEQGEAVRFQGETATYATAYRPRRLKERDTLDLWLNPLTLGQVVPPMPLALRGSITVPVDLEGAYAEVCLDSRL